MPIKVTALDVRLRLCKKCHVLMTQSNSWKILDTLFSEADTVRIVAKSERLKYFHIIIGNIKNNIIGIYPSRQKKFTVIHAGTGMMI